MVTNSARNEAKAKRWASDAIRSRASWLMSVFGQERLTIIGEDDPYLAALREGGAPVDFGTHRYSIQWLCENDVNWGDYTIQYRDEVARLDKTRPRTNEERTAKLEELNRDGIQYAACQLWEWQARSAAAVLAYDVAGKCHHGEIGETAGDVLAQRFRGEEAVALRFAHMGPPCEHLPWLVGQDGVPTLAMDWPRCDIAVLCAKDAVEVCALPGYDELAATITPKGNPVFSDADECDMMEVACDFRIVLRPRDYERFATFPD